MFYLYVNKYMAKSSRLLNFLFFCTSNCQCSIFSKKNQIIRIFCISGWLAVSIRISGVLLHFKIFEHIQGQAEEYQQGASPEHSSKHIPAFTSQCF